MRTMTLGGTRFRRMMSDTACAASRTRRVVISQRGDSGRSQNPQSSTEVGSMTSSCDVRQLCSRVTMTLAATAPPT